MFKSRLKRKKICEILKNINDFGKYTDKEILAYLNALKNEIDKHAYNYDSRFLIYGDREHRLKEFLQYSNQNRTYALRILKHFIFDPAFPEADITNSLALVKPSQGFFKLPSSERQKILQQEQERLNKSRSELSKKTNYNELEKIYVDYYKSGIICIQEKEIIVRMIFELEQKINQNNSFVCDFCKRKFCIGMMSNINGLCKDCRNINTSKYKDIELLVDHEKVKNNNPIIIEGIKHSGKTTKVLFPIVDDIIRKKQSLMFLDFKSEYINYYYSRLVNNGYDIKIINIKDYIKDEFWDLKLHPAQEVLNVSGLYSRSETWNPLRYAYELYKNGDLDGAKRNVEKIIKDLLYKYEKAPDPYWRIAVTNFLTGICLFLFEDAPSEAINFKSIDIILNDGLKKPKFGIAKYMNNYFSLKNKDSIAYKLIAETYISAPPTQADIRSLAKQSISIFQKNIMVEQLLNNDTSFDMKNVFNKPTAIIFILNNDNSELNQLASIFINQLYDIISNLNQYRKFNFILDDVDLLDNLYDVKNILNSSIDKNIQFYVSTDSYEKFLGKYGESLKHICNTISIKNKKMNINIDGKIKHKRLKNKNIKIIEDAKINYPKHILKNVITFDLIDYVDKKQKDMYEDVFKNAKVNDASDNDIEKSETEVKNLLNKMDGIIEGKK